MSRTIPERLLLVLATLAVGCAPAELDFDAVAAELREDPTGDLSWRKALELAPSSADPSAVRALAEELAEAYPDRWEPRWALGKIVRDDEPGRASDLFTEARELAADTGDPQGIASCGNDLGWMAFLEGDFDRGREYYEEGLEAAREANRRDLEAYILNNLAGLSLRTGEFARSREQLELAEAALDELGMEQAARWAAQNRASIYLELGDATGARELLQSLNQRAAEAGDTWFLDASAVILGSLELAQDRPGEARAWYGRVSREIPELADGADFGLGRALIMEGDPALAVSVLRDAADRCRDGHAARALNLEAYAAHADARSGEVEQAEAELRRIVDRSDEVGAGEARWTSRAFLGKLLLDLDRSAESVPLLEKSIEILEAQSAPLDPMGEGLQFLRERTEPYVDLALALARSGEGAEERILTVAGRVQARALEGGPSETSLATVRGALTDGDLLLDYLIGEEAGVLLAVRAGAVRVELISGRRALVGPLSLYRDALRSMPTETTTELDAAARAIGVELGRELLGPVADWLSSATRLYVVPDRELALLPFAALPLESESGGFLGDVVETAVLPRAGAPAGWSAARSPVLLGGKPVLAPGSGFAELPWAAYELSQIRELWGGESASLIEGEGFTLDGLRDAKLDRFRTIHLATHAEASTSDPRRCGVILSGGEKLGIAEIAKLELSQSLVVLSACRTGEGELLPGQGVIGLGWAFLRAGAQGIVVSQWTVDDVASAKLMVAFHRQLRDGSDPVRALSMARRELAADHPHPAFWSPFVAVLRPG